MSAKTNEVSITVEDIKEAIFELRKRVNYVIAFKQLTDKADLEFYNYMCDIKGIDICILAQNMPIYFIKPDGMLGRILQEDITDKHTIVHVGFDIALAQNLPKRIFPSFSIPIDYSKLNDMASTYIDKLDKGDIITQDDYDIIVDRIDRIDEVVPPKSRGKIILLINDFAS